MLWNIGLMIGTMAVVYVAILVLEKPIRAHKKAALIGGLALVVGGLLLLATAIDGPWWRQLLSFALLIVGGSAVGTARSARRIA